MEVVMRVIPTTILAASSIICGCTDVQHRQYGAPDAGGSNTPHECDNPEVVVRDITIQSTEGFSGLPTDCWALTGKLRLIGPNITTLAPLGKLAAVTSLEVSGTKLTSFD